MPINIFNQLEKMNVDIFLMTAFLYKQVASQVVLVVKNLPANARDSSLIPGLGRSTRAGNGNFLQYPCLENFMDGGALQANSPWGCKESDMTKHSTYKQISLKYIIHNNMKSPFLEAITNFGNKKPTCQNHSKLSEIWGTCEKQTKKIP